jgi:hypothetical protein
MAARLWQVMGTTDEPSIGEEDERAMVVEQSYTWVRVPGTDL